MGQKSAEDVRAEKPAAKTRRAAHFEKIAAYDLKYKADAQARREKLASGAGADAPAPEKP
jgi:hypothetical protein